ncbi:MAG TPA: flagellar filament capping protein FliD [Rhodoferax sp.]|nr:flagellar filament capping protein FliD [Rhodoferax sp.]HQC85263.1 flagellar filament capping protein FliD [Rhodoferax sp.]
MATISSPGLGSNLDVKSIVSQLVALEKKPLDNLKLQAATVQTKISAFGQIKSLVSTLSDTLGKLTSVTGWNTVNATSSNSSAVSVSAIGGTLPTTFNVEVSVLAKAKATASAAVLPVGGAIGAGTLTLTPMSGAAVDVAVTATDTVSDVASKINGANAGVTATVLNDASGERLLLRSKTTGLVGGFTLSVADDDSNNADALGLSRLVVGTTNTTTATDAAATVNGIPVTSSTNTFATTVSGVTFSALQVTTAPVEISISKNTTDIQKNIDAFVAAYNAINDVLNEATKYDAATKGAGLLQGDSTALALQNSLRTAIQSVTTGSSVFTRLADVGITQQRGGNLAVDSTKLAAGLANTDELKSMFRSTGGGAADGIAVKIKAVTTSLLSSTGFFQSKENSLKLTLSQNTKNQQQVNERVTKFEASLNARYSALDTKMASLNALNAYVSQQVTTWNKSTS